VHVLLAEGREEKNWDMAQETYSQVQRTIARGDQLELYTDVERLLPDYIKPECLEMVMEIQEYDPSATKRSRKTAGKGPSKKRKRNDDPARDIPPGGCTVLPKAKLKRAQNDGGWKEEREIGRCVTKTSMTRAV
jgi:ATP-dependent DNA helicase MPH1